MKIHRLHATSVAMVLALFATGCGDTPEPDEADEMALILEEPTSESTPDGEAGGSGGAAPAEELEPEVRPVEVDMAPEPPRTPPPAPRPAPQPEPEPEPEVVEPEVLLDAGTQLALSSDLEISTEDMLPGDPVIATVTDDVFGADGSIVVPAGAKLLGRVTRAEESTGSEVDPVLEIAFETLSTDAWERPVQVAVVDVEMESSRKDSDARTAAKIGGAAAVGAILGRVLGGDGDDAVKGGAAGAVAGTVIAMETRSGHAKIKEGALIVIELTEALWVQ